MLKIIPSLSPSGLHWRCGFIAGAKGAEVDAAHWLQNYEAEKNAGEILLTPEELAAHFVTDYPDFVELCRGQNDKYIRWYGIMLNSLNNEELPYAFADHYVPKGYWLTTLGNKIKILPDLYSC